MTKLNRDQQAAVEHEDGPLLVLAGAGSGKTLVVTRRIARLLRRGVPPRSILAVTFTNKAAEEMRVRVTRLTKKNSDELFISTFHAFGLRVLTSEARALGFRSGRFAIFNQSDQASTVREILRGIRTSRKPDIWAILQRISAAKNAFVDPDHFVVREGDEYDEFAQIVYPRYLDALRLFQAFDFDNLVCETVRLFSRRKPVLERWRSRFRYVLVDEYQDTNQAQLELVRLLGEEHRNVCVVGDDDQSIYAWRGADVRNILDFERHYPGAKVVKLQRNYRSTEAILAVANAVIGKTKTRRHAKRLVAAQPGGDLVQVVTADNADGEAAFIVAEVVRLRNEGTALREIAVLYRSNIQSNPLESAFRQGETPYRVIGGTQLYERKEVKDLLAYLRLVLSPKDEISLRRVVNYPARGVGLSAVERLASYAAAKNISLWSAVQRAKNVPNLSSAAMAGCEALAGVVIAAGKRIRAGGPSAEVARTIVSEVGLDADITAGSGSNQVAARRRANLESLLQVLDRHDRSQPRTATSLAQLLQLLSLRTDADDDDPKNVLTLTTMHGAKGLEFDVVFLAGVEEGLIPHSRILDTRVTDAGPQEIEEERRLFYVAVTRAKRQLYLCRSRHRVHRGKAEKRTPSRFLDDVPDSLLSARDVRDPTAPTTRGMLDGVAQLLAALEK